MTLDRLAEALAGSAEPAPPVKPCKFGRLLAQLGPDLSAELMRRFDNARSPELFAHWLASTGQTVAPATLRRHRADMCNCPRALEHAA